MSEAVLTKQIYEASIDLTSVTEEYREVYSKIINRNFKKKDDLLPRNVDFVSLSILLENENFKLVHQTAKRSSKIILDNSPLFSRVSATYPLSKIPSKIKYVDQMGGSVHGAFSITLRNLDTFYDIFILDKSTPLSERNDDWWKFANLIKSIWIKPSELMKIHMQYELDRLVDISGLPEGVSAMANGIQFNDGLGCVEYGNQVAILGDKQYPLFKYIYKHKKAKLDDLIKHVWNGNSKTENVTKCMKRTNDNLEEQDLFQYFELRSSRGHIILVDKTKEDT